MMQNRIYRIKNYEQEQIDSLPDAFKIGRSDNKEINSKTCLEDHIRPVWI
jgi:hypothetical protein